MKEFLMNKKFLLTLDDMKNKSYINDVVFMDVLHSNKDSILIMTKKNCKIVKDYAIEIHKFDIEELNKDTSLKLFSTYACRDDNILPRELIEIGKPIVKSCNGLT
uniref:NB-ARC domain-containing protein n=1 Tax=Physcomitrium patens TaxID=3218 RepID=A0A2K1KI51_PHYPA|nr:hypothetical protein PHYPA_007130 [Physcomitrium patens]